MFMYMYGVCHLKLLCNGVACPLQSRRVQFRLVLQQPLPVLSQMQLLVHVLEYTLQSTQFSACT